LQPDEIDWKIIDILRKGHVPNIAIARKLGLSESTIRQRIKKLKKSGILEIKALINPEVLESKLLVVIAVNLKETKLLDIKAKEIAELENVLHVIAVSGQYDLLVEVLLDSNRGLMKFLTDTLTTVEGISTTQSFIALKSYRKFV